MGQPQASCVGKRWLPQNHAGHVGLRSVFHPGDSFGPDSREAGQVDATHPLYIDRALIRIAGVVSEALFDPSQHGNEKLQCASSWLAKSWAFGALKLGDSIHFRHEHDGFLTLLHVPALEGLAWNSRSESQY